MVVPEVPQVAARRVVTVLFADLVGFTSLSERLDPEDVAMIQQAYFARSRDAIEAIGGSVEKFIGDAVVATFGVPHAGEHDAVHAITAGLAIVQAVEDLGAALPLPEGSLRVRVGVNTGEVHATPAEHGDWQLTGNVMNVAARFQAAADPGTVLVGAETAFAAELTFVVAYAGDLELKGKAKSVPAWRVIGRRSEPTRASTLHGLSAPTLGRDRELDALMSSIEQVDAVRSGWLIVAPAGTGKSRLVDELADRARRRGHDVWRAFATGDLSRSNHLPRQLLLAALTEVDEDLRTADREVRRAAVLTQLARRSVEGPRAELAADHVVALLDDEPLIGEPTDLHRSWIAALDSCLADPSAGSHAVWIVEDLHLAPPDAWSFFDDALREPSPRRTVVLTARPGALAASGEIELRGATVLHLPPLEPRDVDAMIEGIVGAGVVPPDVARGIEVASSGNPLFVEELLRTWVLADVLRRDSDGSWAFTTGEHPLSVPSTVHAIYQSQLDDLEGVARRVATSGSVPGHSFPPAALPALGVDEPKLGIDELTTLGFVAGPHRGPAAIDVYTYRHGLLRDVAYASLPRAERAQLHLRFATWMATASDQAATEELVGTHLAAAHESLPALAEIVDGQWSRDQLATESAAHLERAAIHQIAQQPGRAAELLAQALDIEPSAGAGVIARRRIVRGEALHRAGRLEAAMTSFAQAVEALEGRRGEDHEEAAVRRAAALGYEDALFASRRPRDQWGPVGLDLIDRALDLAAGSDRARLLAARGRALAYAGRLDEGRAACEEARLAADAADDPAALASALLSLRAIQTGPRDLGDRLDNADQVAAASRRAGDRGTELEGWRLQFVDLLEAGEMDRASIARHEAETIIDDLRQPVSLWYPAMWSAMDAVRRGDAAASTYVEAFREEGERWGYGDVRMVYGVQALQLALDEGHVDTALPLVRSLQTDYPTRFASVRAAAAAAAGADDEAVAMIEVHARDGFAGVQQDLSWLYSISMYALAAQLVDDVASSRVLADLLVPWADHFVVLGSGALCLGAASGFVACALLGAGENERAEPFALDAVERNRRTACAPAMRWAQALLATIEERQHLR